MRRKLLGSLIVLQGLAIIACSPDPQVVTTEITREVPVTVETIQTVEVTREIPVTVETTQQIEVTRIAEVTREVPITQEVPVTRLVEAIPTVLAERPTATPEPAASATPEPIIVDGVPTPEPTTAMTVTPTPEPVTTFDSWRMRSAPAEFGHTTVVHFENIARKWEAGAEAPVLVYECDNRQGRSMYVDWYFAVSTQQSYYPRYSNDPFHQYRDEDLDALVNMAGRLLGFVEQAEINRVDAGQLEQLWKSLRTQWRIDPDNAADLVDRVRERSHRIILVAAEFYTHRPDHPAGQKYGPTLVDDITGDWVVLPGHRTQMNAADLGSIRRAYQNVEGAASPRTKTDRLMIARVQEPEQVGSIMAEWEITGLDKVMGHCRAMRN